jgi:Holliday junction resolvase
MSASKRKGTGWESAVVQYLKENGVTQAERRALTGAKDRGDIAGIPGVVIECKNEARIDLASYANETEQERLNDGARIGIT